MTSRSEKQSFVNRMMFLYGSMENAYKDHYSITKIPKCTICDVADCTFISYFKGYRDYCKNCHFKKGILTSKKNKDLYRQSSIYESYISFIKSNIKLYKEASFPFYDPFLEKELNSFRSSFKKADIYDINVCLYTGDEYKYHYLKNNDIDKYLSTCKRTALLRKHLSVDDILSIIRCNGDTDSMNKIYQLNKYTFILLKKLYNFKKPIIETERRDIVYHLKFSLNDKQYNCSFSSEEYYLKSNIYVTDIIAPDMDDNIYKTYYCVTCNKKYYNWYAFFKKTSFINHGDTSVTVMMHGYTSPYSCGDVQCYTKKKEYWPRSDDSIKKHKNTMHKLILTGYRPPMNRYTSKLKYKIDGINMRSSWEVIFYICMTQLGHMVEYETLVIKYKNDKSTSKSYIVDFVIDGNLYEIKPIVYTKKPNNMMKILAGYSYANEHNCAYFLITEDELSKIVVQNLLLLNAYLDNNEFDGKSNVIKAITYFIKYGV